MLISSYYSYQLKDKHNRVWFSSIIKLRKFQYFLLVYFFFLITSFGRCNVMLSESAVETGMLWLIILWIMLKEFLIQLNDEYKSGGTDNAQKIPFPCCIFSWVPWWVARWPAGSRSARHRPWHVHPNHEQPGYITPTTTAITALICIVNSYQYYNKIIGIHYNWLWLTSYSCFSVLNVLVFNCIATNKLINNQLIDWFVQLISNSTIVIKICFY